MPWNCNYFMIAIIFARNFLCYIGSMKITERLVGDHNTFRKMMEELDATVAVIQAGGEKKRLVRLVELFADHLIIHSWGEDHFYHPAVREIVPKMPKGSWLTVAYMETLQREHLFLDKLLERLEQEVKSHPMTPGWSETYGWFSQALLSHMKKEEEDLFPLTEIILGKERLEKLSMELEMNRCRAPKSRMHLCLYR